MEAKGDKGIFAGEHIMRAMSRSTGEHIRLFLSYMNAYPRSYLGTSYKFSEMYATWVIGSTPLAEKDVMPWLMNIRDKNARYPMIKNLASDIGENELPDKWFNDGMLMANADNIDSAQYMADLIKDACAVLKDKSKEGWGDYLAGYAEKKLGNYKRADTLFRIAAKKFKESQNKEGVIWASNALTNLNSSREVTVTLQTSHFSIYHGAIAQLQVPCHGR
jgi:hypothetical protein